jgi:hypothetical protein
MASVRLDFTPPTAPGITALHIEEASAKEGVFAEIEEVTAVGTYPNYISYYTTDNAVAANGWFRIRWEDADGIFTAYSSPLQGGTKTLVQEIVDRVMLRMPNANEIIVTQEAQAAVSLVFFNRGSQLDHGQRGDLQGIARPDLPGDGPHDGWNGRSFCRRWFDDEIYSGSGCDPERYDERQRRW